MKHIFIDESGSMTTKYCKHYPCFVVTLVVPHDRGKVKRVFKRFISKNMERLKKLDVDNKMFKNGTFCELKGSCLDAHMKNDFLDYFYKSNIFEVYYIVIKNSKIKYGLYDNTARAFNYVLKLGLVNFIKKYQWEKDRYMLHIDERNEKTNSTHFLEEYLNTEICLHENLVNNFNVQYYDSSCNNLIQMADVFSNIYYSNSFNSLYKEKLNLGYEKGIIRAPFIFP